MNLAGMTAQQAEGRSIDTTPRRASQVQVALDRQEKEINLLQESLGGLAMRLQPVVRQNETSQGNGKEVRPLSSTELAGRLDRHTDQIEALRAAVRELTDRLEL